MGDTIGMQFVNSLKIRRFSLTKLSLFFIVGLMYTHGAQARNGLFPHFVGTHGMLSGAGTALPLDASNVIANPAHIGRLPTHVALFQGVFNQDQSLDSSSALLGNPIGKQKNRYKTLFVNDAGFNYRINEKWAFGIGMSGGGGFVAFKSATRNPGALNPPNGNFDNEAVNRVILTAPTLAYNPTKGQSYGISLLVGYSDFWMNLGLPNGQQISGQLQSNKVFGVGVRIGGMWDVNKYLTIGSSAATPVFFAKYNKYPEFQDAYEIPATFRFGIAVHFNPQTDFVLDFKGIYWGKVNFLHKNLGWGNQAIILTGIQHKFTDSLTVGIGYNYGKSPIYENKVFFNALSIPLDEHHISGGVRYKVTESVELIGIGYFIPHKKMTDDGTSMPGGVSRGATIESRTIGGTLGLRVNF